MRASAIEDDLSLEASAELTGKGRYQITFDYAFLTNTQAPSAGADPFAEFQLLWDQNPSAPQLPYERVDRIFRIARSDLVANPSLQQAGGCGQGGVGNASYPLCTGWRRPTVDVPSFYNGQRFVLRLLLQDGGATFSDTDPVTSLIPENAYASVLTLDNFKVIGLPVITGSTQTPDGPVAINTPFSIQVTYEYADPSATHTAAINWTNGTGGPATTTQANGARVVPIRLAFVRGSGALYGSRDRDRQPGKRRDGRNTGRRIRPDGRLRHSVRDGSSLRQAHTWPIHRSPTKRTSPSSPRSTRRPPGWSTGSANFRFQAADLTFDGTSYDWLRVAGPRR